MAAVAERCMRSAIQCHPRAGRRWQGWVCRGAGNRQSHGPMAVRKLSPQVWCFLGVLPARAYERHNRESEAKTGGLSAAYQCQHWPPDSRVSLVIGALVSTDYHARCVLLYWQYCRTWHWWPWPPASFSRLQANPVPCKAPGRNDSAKFCPCAGWAWPKSTAPGFLACFAQRGTSSHHTSSPIRVNRVAAHAPVNSCWDVPVVHLHMQLSMSLRTTSLPPFQKSTMRPTSVVADAFIRFSWVDTGV